MRSRHTDEECRGFGCTAPGTDRFQGGVVLCKRCYYREHAASKRGEAMHLAQLYTLLTPDMSLLELVIE